MSPFFILFQYREAFISGLKVTIELALIIWLIGVFAGTVFGILAARFRLQVGVPIRVISFFLSGIPILVMLYWAHYPLQVLLKVVINPFYTAAAVLTLVNIFAVADLVFAHLRDFPEEYKIAAKVSGISPGKTILKIQLPIILRQLIPALLPLQVVMLQSTLFASLISVEEVFRVAQRINSVVYKPVEIYSALALLFILTCLPVNGLALWLRARFTRDLSES
jgi:polar amino acid transport system permease protein